MKKMIITSLCVLFALGSFAQDNAQAQELKKNKTYLVGGFGDNWFVSAGVGGQLFFEGGLGNGSFMDHVSPAFDVSIGKWFSPIMGVRLQLNGFNANGLTKNQSVFTSGNPNTDGYYKFDFGYISLHGDFLFNLGSQFFRYNEERCYELIPFVGLGVASAFKDGEIKDNELAAHVGLLNQFRLSPRWDINLELRTMIVNPRFAVPSTDVSGIRKYLQGTTSLTVGVNYKFGKETYRFEPGLTQDDINAIQEKSAKDINDAQAKLNECQKALADAERRANENKGNVKDKERADRLQKENDELRKALNEKPSATASDDCHMGLKVFFEIGKTELDEWNTANLEYFANNIKNSNKTYVITGYADSSTGYKKRNEQLAQKRAQTVYNTLIEKFGINKNNLSISSEVIKPEGVDAKFVRMAEVK